MLPIRFDRLTSVLCLGAHPDDIEIGCGATVSQLLSPKTEITWIVFSGDAIRHAEANASANTWLQEFDNHRIEIFDNEDGFFPSNWDSIKRDFREIAANVTPDLIFTHHLQDRHQDHRVIADLTWQTFRNQTILEYEIPKFEGDLSFPNLFVPIEEKYLDCKVDRLFEHHRSQAAKDWFDRDLFKGCARLRGVECSARFAEAFHARKLVMQ